MIEIEEEPIHPFRKIEFWGTAKRVDSLLAPCLYGHVGTQNEDGNYAAHRIGNM